MWEEEKLEQINLDFGQLGNFGKILLPSGTTAIGNIIGNLDKCFCIFGSNPAVDCQSVVLFSAGKIEEAKLEPINPSAAVARSLQSVHPTVGGACSQISLHLI